MKLTPEQIEELQDALNVCIASHGTISVGAAFFELTQTVEEFIDHEIEALKRDIERSQIHATDQIDSALTSQSAGEQGEEPVAEIHSGELRWLVSDDERPNNVKLYTGEQKFAYVKAAVSQAMRNCYCYTPEHMEQVLGIAQPAIPEGLNPVPIKPTKEMWDAAWSAFGATKFEDMHPILSIDHIKRLYAMFHEVMLSAAPSHPIAADITDEDIGYIAQQVGLIGTIGDHPNYEEKLITFVRAVFRFRAAAQDKVSEQNARFAIDAAIDYGRNGYNRPPSDDHWLMPYWEIGQKLAEREVAAQDKDGRQT